MKTALVMARKTHRPIFVRVYSDQFPSGASTSQFESASVLEKLSKYVLLRQEYSELQAAVPSIPPVAPMGMSGIMILDPSGRFVKRLSGFVLEADVLYVLQRAEWRMRQALAPPQPVTELEEQTQKAFFAAMDGDLSNAFRITAAIENKLNPDLRAKLYEAMADECRARGNYRGALKEYQAALNRPLSHWLAERLRLRYALCMYRLSDNQGAKTELERLLRENPSSTWAQQASRFLERINFILESAAKHRRR